MASAKECHDALNRLAATLADIDPSLRSKHVPNRTVSCRISDLDVVFCGRVDSDGVHELRRAKDGTPDAEVKVVVASDDLLALADGEDDLLHAWLKGRVQVSAPVRDVLRLRSVLGL